MVHVAFPLTPGLSLRERANRKAVFGANGSHGFNARNIVSENSVPDRGGEGDDAILPDADGNQSGWAS